MDKADTNRRRMIRLDDVDSGEDGYEDSSVEMADDQDNSSTSGTVGTHTVHLCEYTMQGGVRYQRCGGGRRRMAKRSN